jgi:hypothetical protein
MTTVEQWERIFETDPRSNVGSEELLDALVLVAAFGASWWKNRKNRMR